MNSQNKKIALIALGVALLLTIVVVIYWHRKINPAPTPARPSMKEQLQDIGKQQPSEPATVFVISGQITSINNERTTIQLVTTRGDKSVELTPTTIFQRQADTGRPATPPPALIDRNSPPAATQTATREDLLVGQLVQIESLTNISGLSTFTANKLTIID